MNHPEGFSDSEHIVIRNNEPFFYYSGNSYKERLKDGTSLEHMFQMENNEPFNKPFNEPFNKPFNDPFNKPFNEPFNKPIDSPITPTGKKNETNFL